MSDKIYPKGIICFSKREGAPDFVIGDMVIDLDDLRAWLKDNPQHVSEYNGKKQLKLNMAFGRDGRPSVSVNTYRPAGSDSGQPEVKAEDDLPF